VPKSQVVIVWVASAGSLVVAYQSLGKYYLPVCEGSKTYTKKIGSAFLWTASVV
jgi:hypothetical protein